jgi:hypothetical protein
VACESAFEDDRAARYVAGELSEADREAFEVHVLECDACRAAVEAHLDLADGLRRAAPRHVAARPPRTWLPVAAALAATALAGTIVLRDRWTPAPTTIPPSPTVAVPPMPVVDKPDVVLPAGEVLVTRGGAGRAFLEDFGPAIAPYREGDYALAADRLATLADRYPASFEVPFYRGVSLLLLGRASEAVEALTRAEALARGPQATEARWYLSLALARAGRTAEAARRLDALCDGTGPRRDAACAAGRGLGPQAGAGRP